MTFENTFATIENYPSLADNAVQPAEMRADFSDYRIFLNHDAEAVRVLAGGGNLYYNQSTNGPTEMFINRDVSDKTLGAMADRHGLMLDELRAFRDQTEFLRMEATLLAA